MTSLRVNDNRRRLIITMILNGLGKILLPRMGRRLRRLVGKPTTGAPTIKRGHCTSLKSVIKVVQVLDLTIPTLLVLLMIMITMQTMFLLHPPL